MKSTFRNNHEIAQYLHSISDELYRVAVGLMKSHADAQDVLSETFMKVFKHHKSVKDSRYFKTWIVRVLINTCKDHLKKRRSYIELNETLEISNDPVENYDFVHDIVEKLPFDLKNIIILKYFNEYTYKDIATILELPESTVKSRCTKGLKMMRQEMEVEDNEQ